MKRASVITMCILICAGCRSANEKTPVWGDVKIKELAAARHSQPTGSVVEPSVQFNVYIFSVPAANFASARDSWTTLSTKSILFTNLDLFGKNGFVVGAGRTDTWEPIAEKLRAAGGKNQRTVDLIMPPNNTDYVSLIRFAGEKNIFYRMENNQVNGVTLGPGEAMLRLTAATIPDMRGVCSLTVEPIFKNVAKPDVSSAGADELAFNTVSFRAKMSPGDLILLGPANYAKQDMTLSGIFFAAQNQPVVQLYLIVCMEVSN
jgi:hypothetical protein